MINIVLCVLGIGSMIWGVCNHNREAILLGGVLLVVGVPFPRSSG